MGKMSFFPNAPRFFFGGGGGNTLHSCHILHIKFDQFFREDWQGP